VSRSPLHALAVSAAACLLSCRTDQTLVTPHPHLERMLEQEKVLPYENVPYLPRGMAMQQPPDGTEPVDAPLGDPLVTAGVADGRYAERIPVRLDRAMVEHGRHQFETMCAPCHGILGNADSVIAERMNLVKPANLLGAARGFPPGKIFEVIRLGYGLMPSYRNQLSVDDSWAVVAYVRALQLSQAVPVDRLPPHLRARLEAQ
jgi:mono/diheme cytochrome c family protein